MLWDVAELQSGGGKGGWFWSRIPTRVSGCCEELGQTTDQ